MGRLAALRLLTDASIACVADASHLGPRRSQRDPQDFCHGLLDPLLAPGVNSLTALKGPTRQGVYRERRKRLHSPRS